MMTDIITVDTLYAQGEKILPKWGDSQIYVKLAGKDTVYGYYKTQIGIVFFYSLDGLKTIVKNEISSDWDVSYFEKENIIIQRRYGSISDFGGFEVKESTDFGKSFIPKVKNLGLYWVYTYSPTFNRNREGVFFVEQSFSGKISSSGFDVYKISSNSYNKISQVYLTVNYLSIPKLLFFADEKNIFFIAYGIFVSPKPSYIVHSNDGGLTWESKLIENMPPINNYGNNEYLHNKYLTVISKNKYAFYLTQSVLAGNGQGYEDILNVYYTYDAGVNWLLKDFKIPGYIKSIQFVDSQIGYMLVRTKDGQPKDLIYKSTDSGETWYINGPEVYAKSIYFDSKNNGIAISNKIVQVTHDGGLTWKLLTYFEEYN